MRITVNLATRPFADLGPALKRARIALGVLALASLVFWLGLRAVHQRAEEARARDHSLDGQIARITAERQDYQALMRQPANATVLAQAESLNQLFDEKAFSWTLAMEDLETVLPGGVQVTTIEPARAKDGHITLRLRVVGPRNRVVELVENLEHSRRFLQPRIVSENSETTGGPGQRVEPVSATSSVNFDILAEYNPPPPGAHKPAREKAPPGEYPASAPARDDVPATPPQGNPPPGFPGPGTRRVPYTGHPVNRNQPPAGGPQ